MKESNRNNGRVSIELVDDPPDRERHSFLDSNSPEFSPPKETATNKKKPWKRKLIGWCFILLIIVAGVFALYILLRVKRVDVRVQADSQRASQTAKAEPSPKNTEGGLSAEAINIAREAVGPDATTVLNIASANASPSPSPIAAQHAQRTLSYTDNSPAYASSSDLHPPMRAEEIRIRLNRIPAQRQKRQMSRQPHYRAMLIQLRRCLLKMRR
jgi:hypothetical protein